jgi:hypothetical protein
MPDEEPPPLTDKQIRAGINGLSRNLQNLYAAHNAMSGMVEILGNVLKRVAARRGGDDGRVCGLCLVNDKSAGGIIVGDTLLLFPHKTYGKLCNECVAVMKSAESKAKMLGEAYRAQGDGP